MCVKDCIANYFWSQQALKLLQWPLECVCVCECVCVSLTCWDIAELCAMWGQRGQHSFRIEKDLDEYLQCLTTTCYCGPAFYIRPVGWSARAHTHTHTVVHSQARSSWTPVVLLRSHQSSLRVWRQKQLPPTHTAGQGRHWAPQWSPFSCIFFYSDCSEKSYSGLTI